MTNERLNGSVLALAQALQVVVEQSVEPLYGRMNSLEGRMDKLRTDVKEALDQQDAKVEQRFKEMGAQIGTIVHDEVRAALKDSPRENR